MPAAAADFLKRILRLVDKVCPECAQTNLHKRAVEEDLGVDVEVGDGLLQMGHEKHVTSFVVLVVKSKVVDLAEIGSRSDDVEAVLEKIGAQCLH